MPYSESPSPALVGLATSPDPASVPSSSSVCTRRDCDDPASVVLAVADDLVDLGDDLPVVLTSRLCCTHARDAVDDLLRHAALGRPTPSLALSAIDQEA